jgi:ribosomal protein S18 acetylase RimI-like enzyme
MTCQDWRACAASEIAPLLEREAAAWRRELDWDVRWSWRVLEPARAAGTLPGFVARNPRGRILGWTWFLKHADCLQVAALCADEALVARRLAQAVLESEPARTAATAVWSVRGTPPGLRDVLTSAGLDAARYLFLRGALADGGPDPGGRPWGAADRHAAELLCRRSYGDRPHVRAFAPGGTAEEWRDYLRALFETDGCGVFLPEASFVEEDAAGELTGGIIASTIAPGIAHVSQIVVRPDCRGAGLGRRLLLASMRACAARGYRAMTLLVAEDNAPARALYARTGFERTAEFLVAVSQPRRLTSVAPASGGVSTRR